MATSTNDTLFMTRQFFELFPGHEELLHDLIRRRLLRPHPLCGTEELFFTTKMKEAVELILQRRIPVEMAVKEQFDEEGNLLGVIEQNIYSVDPRSQNPVLDRRALRAFDRTKSVEQSEQQINNQENVNFGVEETQIVAPEIVVTEPATTDVPATEHAEVSTNTETTNVEETRPTVVGNVVEWLLHTPSESFFNEEENEIISSYSQNMILGETHYGKLSLERIRHLPEFEANRPNNFRRLTRMETIAYLLMSLGILSDEGRREIFVDKANIINTLTNRELETAYIETLETKYAQNRTGVEEAENNLEETVVEEHIEATVSARERITALLELPDEVLEELWSRISSEIPAELS